ncbi:hypothetical protein GQ54DRAFT_300984, partial [Martensiomyces pterosporus]
MLLHSPEFTLLWRLHEKRAPCPRIPIAGTRTRKPGEHQRVGAQPTLSSGG